jgi:hypothetical protein
MGFSFLRFSFLFSFLLTGHQPPAGTMDHKTDILSTLAYFDLFQYPVTAKEIYFFLPRPMPIPEFEKALRELLSGGLVFCWEEVYSVRNEPALMQRRQKGNRLAAEMLFTAEKVARLLAGFPYILGVGVSGSLSKQYADEGSDIDLFIITTKNRLWIARTCLHLLKKLSFLIHREDWFCMNYFVDEMALEIPEKNMYTAIEIVTLIPMKGAPAFDRFLTANRWTDQALPHSYRRLMLSEDRPASYMKRIFEALFDNAFGDALDRWLMHLTASRWLKKTRAGKRNNRGVVMSLAATRHTARPAPGDYQRWLLDTYETKVVELSKKLLRREMI